MKEKDYLKHWILPMGGIHQWEEDLKIYYGQLIGNSPENNNSTLALLQKDGLLIEECLKLVQHLSKSSRMF
jgi:hypothetical protein